MPLDVPVQPLAGHLTPRCSAVALRETRVQSIALVERLALDIGTQVINQSDEWLILFATTALWFLVLNSVTVSVEVIRRYPR